jgi:hypothetical protein
LGARENNAARRESITANIALDIKEQVMAFVIITLVEQTYRIMQHRSPRSSPFDTAAVRADSLPHQRCEIGCLVRVRAEHKIDRARHEP